MNGETTRDLLLILVMAVVTFATRLLPFLLFDRGRSPPRRCSIWGGCCPRHHCHAHRLLSEGYLLYLRRRLDSPGGVDRSRGGLAPVETQ